MVSVKGGLSEEGDFSRRAEFLKGHLPKDRAGPTHQPSWAPEGGEHGMLTVLGANKQGQGFLFWQLPEPTLHKMVTRTLFLVNPEKKRTSYSLVLRWRELEVPPAMFVKCEVLLYILCGLLSCTSHYNSSFLKNQTVGGNPVSYLFLRGAVDRACSATAEWDNISHQTPSFTSQLVLQGTAGWEQPAQTDWGNLTKDPSSLKAWLGKNTKTWPLITAGYPNVLAIKTQVEVFSEVDPKWPKWAIALLAKWSSVLAVKVTVAAARWFFYI